MRYIDADKLICSIDGAESLDTESDYDKVARFIEEAETADVAEVRHEEWVFSGQKKTKSGYRFTYHCSRCFRLVRRDLDEAPINEIYPYCHCGAKMDKEKTI